MEHRDLAGNEIKVGDYIVYAALWDRSAILKYGKVTRLAIREPSFYSNQKETPTLRLKSVDRNWDNEWELQKEGKDITLGFTNRLLVVSAASVPYTARMLLDMPPPGKHDHKWSKCPQCMGKTE